MRSCIASKRGYTFKPRCRESLARYRLADRLGPHGIGEVVRAYKAGATSGELGECFDVSPSGRKGLLHTTGANVRTPRGMHRTRWLRANGCIWAAGCCGLLLVGALLRFRLLLGDGRSGRLPGWGLP